MNQIRYSDEETCYGYCNEYQPHAVKRMFDYKNEMLYDMRWDEAGNLGQVSMGKPGEMFERGRFLFWTEDCCGCEHRLCQSNVVSNRMHAAVDDKYFSYYVYDHSGERRLKLTGDSKLLDVCQRLRTPQNKLNEVSNADLMATYTVLNEPTLYPSSYMVLNNKGYTKHYYAGTERVAARLGGGGLDAQQHVIAIDDELQWRADKLFKQSLDHVNHRVLGENDLDCIMRNKFSPEVLGEWIEGIPYYVQAEVAVDNGQFKDMIHSMLDDPHDGKEKEVYFYHSDHLGSASWITDYSGKAVQHIQYLPYGEPYINQRAAGTTYSERFRFTGKERDEETGYGYFGARYMDHELMTMWLSVDPMADKYPSISPYAYCAWNPVKLVDPDGRQLDIPNEDDENHQKTKNDILSLVKEENRSRVIFNGDGSVSINRDGLSDWQLMEGDKGLGLLYDMVKSEKKFFYETSDDFSSVMDDGRTHEMVELLHGVVNASNNGKDSKGGYTHKPKEGYDGHVILAKSGSWRTKKGYNLKPSLLFHELAENYYRTDKGFDYKKAHSEAIKREGVAAYHNTSPGCFNAYNVVYEYKGTGKARWSLD